MALSQEYKSYEEIILNNRKTFEAQLSQILQEVNTDKKLNLCKKAINFAVNNGTGYYSSDVIEKTLLEISALQTLGDISDEYKNNSVLHVLTETYVSGGHTRVVERWIELSPEGQTHSLITTENQKQDIPERLQKAIQDKNGTIIKLNDKMSDMDKALELRKIASNYQYIILHTHMHDVIPVLAFGHPEFKRPVVLFNHADHLFWVGASIADTVAELRKFGSEISVNKRGIVNNQILGIPIDLKEINTVDKNIARKKLKLSQNKKIILTFGRAKKYRPMGDLDFLKFAEQIIEEKDDIYIIAIGIKYRTLPEWKKFAAKYKNRVKFLKSVPYNELLNYIYASDIVIDSFPMSGGTALIDAISCNKPVFSVHNPVQQMDYLSETSALASNIKELKSKLYELLDNTDLQNANNEELKAALKSLNAKDVWLENLENIYDSLPETHTIQPFKTNKEFDPIDLDAFLTLKDKKNKTIFNFPGKRIKWGVSYSVFDGEELLEPSLLSIRKSVDYINVVYQLNSWYGNPANPNLLLKIKELKNKGLIDEIIEYKPNYKKSAGYQEKQKRNLGLKYAKKASVNYFMTMDTDEFYIKEELEKAKEFILKNKITHSIIQQIPYGTRPEQRNIQLQDCCLVQFFCKINRFSKLKKNKKLPALVDPTRQLNHKLFSKYFLLHFIKMHHMSYVRNDLNRKCQNSSYQNLPVPSFKKEDYINVDDIFCINKYLDNKIC